MRRTRWSRRNEQYMWLQFLLPCVHTHQYPAWEEKSVPLPYGILSGQQNTYPPCAIATLNLAFKGTGGPCFLPFGTLSHHMKQSRLLYREREPQGNTEVLDLGVQTPRMCRAVGTLDGCTHTKDKNPTEPWEMIMHCCLSHYDLGWFVIR